MELILILVVCAAVIYVAIKVYSSNSQKQLRSDVATVVQAQRSGVYTGGSKKQLSGKPAKWYKAGESVSVQGYGITGGLVYVGETLPDTRGFDNDACLINPTLPVSPAEPWDGGDEMGYWPHYADISPKCRGAYLKWLAGGRSEPEADIGYVFLFFYGLERRLFVDALKESVSSAERAEIVQEVIRLLKIYGGNRSFRGYANNFLAMEWVLFQNNNPVPSYLDLSDRYCSQPFQVVLAKYVVAGQPIPAEVALQWIALHPEFGLKTPARRCAREFKELFSIRYKQQFGDGLVVKPNKTPLMLQCRFASPSLWGDLSFRVPDLPNPFILTAPLNRLRPLVEECTNDLEPYSRFLGRKNNDPNSVAALALLPKELKHLSPAVHKAGSLFTEFCASGVRLISVEDLYSCFGENAPLQIDKKEAENLAALVEGTGFGIVPDIRFHNIKPNLDGKVALFPKGHGIDFRPSTEYRRLISVIRLGAMVSQIDDDVSTAEAAILQNLINESRELTQPEKDSLHAFLQWCLYTPQRTAGIKQRLSEASPAEKTAISRVLISVAFADGRVDPKEVKHLEKFYPMIGLDKEQVISDIHTLAAAGGLVTVGLPDGAPSLSIPASAIEPVQAKGFSLNEELIRVRLEETRQVKDILEGVFAEPEEEQAESDVDATVPPFENPLALLDQAHQDLFHCLLEKEAWERHSLQELCKELGLMVDGAMEVLNEWSIEQANVPLIEDGDPVYVDVDLAKELVTA